MKRIELLIEVEYDNEIMHGGDMAARNWFVDAVLGGKLSLHSDEIGDDVGEVKVLSNLDTVRSTLEDGSGNG